MISLIILIFFLAINVTGQGHMLFPQIRIPNEDVDLSITRSPTTSFPCGSGQQIGQVLTKYVAGQTVNIKWEIGVAHEGECFIDLSTDGRDTNFYTIKSLPGCADKVGTNFQANIQLPSDITCDHCTLRFRWQAKLTEETYLNCADVSIYTKNTKNRFIKRHKNKTKTKNKTKNKSKPTPTITIPSNCILSFERNLICRY